MRVHFVTCPVRYESFSRKNYFNRAEGSFFLSFFERCSSVIFLRFHARTLRLQTRALLSSIRGEKKKKKNCSRVIPKLCEEFVSRKDGERVRYFLPRHLVCTGTKLHTCVQSVTHTHVMLYAHRVTVNLESFSSCRDRVQCGLLWFSKSW